MTTHPGLSRAVYLTRGPLPRDAVASVRVVQPTTVMDRVYRLRRLFVGLLLGVAASVPAAAQQAQPSAQALPLVPGSRVRVTATGLVAPLVANYLELRGDTLVLFEDGTGRGIWSFALDQVERLETTAGERAVNRPYIMRGALIGGAIGALSGVIFAASANPSDPSEEYSMPLTGVLGAAVGAGIGGLIGSRFTTEGWVPVPLPRRTARGLGLTLRFHVVY